MSKLRILLLAASYAFAASAWAGTGLTNAGVDDPALTDPNNPATSAAAAAAQTAALANQPNTAGAGVVGTPNSTGQNAAQAAANATGQHAQAANGTSGVLTPAQQAAADTAKVAAATPPPPPPVPEPEHVSVMRVLPKAAPVVAPSDIPTLAAADPVIDPPATAVADPVPTPPVATPRTQRVAPAADTMAGATNVSKSGDSVSSKVDAAPSSSRYFALGGLGIAGLIVAAALFGFMRSSK